MDSTTGLDVFDRTLTFIETLIGHLAWPMTILILVFTFKKQIHSLLGNLNSLKYKEFEAQFGNLLDSVTSGTESLPSPPSPSNQNTDSSNPTNTISVNEDTKSLVLKSWNDINRALKKAVVKYNGIDVPPGRTFEQEIEVIKYTGRVSQSFIKAITDAREIRNLVIHSDKYEITTEQARHFTIEASKIAKHLEELAN